MIKKERSSIRTLICLVCMSVIVGVIGSTTALATTPSVPDAYQGTRVVILGTAAGRTSWKGLPSGGPSTAIQVDGDVYVIDFGRDWEDRFFQAGLGSRPGRPVDAMGHGLETLVAGFITHLHGDHVVGLPQLLLFGASDGLANREVPFQLYGPGPRGSLYVPPDTVHQPANSVNPEFPAPGTVVMFNKLREAYATGLNDNIIDSGKPNPQSYIHVHNITLPPRLHASASTNPVPRVKNPFLVYRDENVTVTATLLDHGAMFPTFAFRFDTPDGSIVVSGDHKRQKNNNLVRLASGADILLHPVIDRHWVKSLFPKKSRTPKQNAKAQQLMHELHTTPIQVGEIASEADVGMVALIHLAPPTLNESDVIRKVHEQFGGPVYVSVPFMVFTLDGHHVEQSRVEPMTKKTSIME